MIKRNDTGPAVVQLQRQLVELSYDLPRFGVDGQCGDETFIAMKRFLVAHGQDVDDHDYATISDAEIVRLMDVGAAVRGAVRGAEIVDRTAYSSKGPFYGWRPWKQVTGIMVHHTACWLSTSKDIARCDGIGAHRVIYPDGTRIKLHELTEKIAHGNGGNARCGGIEIDGNFQGVEGDDSTRWKPGGRKAVRLEAQIEAAKQQIRDDVAEVAAHGGRVEFLLVHRQASGDRRGDPGSLLYKEVVLPLLAELHLSDGGPGFVFPDGYGGQPVPEAWDERCKGIVY